MYSQVPVGAGQIPVVVSRPKEKVEALLNLLTIVVACLGLLLPAVCLANYPQGALTEPVMFLEKVYLVVFAGFLLVMEISHGTRIKTYTYYLGADYCITTRSS